MAVSAFGGVPRSDIGHPEAWSDCSVPLLLRYRGSQDLQVWQLSCLLAWCLGVGEGGFWQLAQQGWRPSQHL